MAYSPLRWPSFTPCNCCIDSGDDDGLNDKEKKRVTNENGERKAERLHYFALSKLLGTKKKRNGMGNEKRNYHDD